MASDISICANALVRLGQAPISSFTEGEIGETCGLIYPDFVRSVISSYPWRFSMDKVQLARLSASPVNVYQYAFQLPSNLLNLRAVYNSSSTGVSPVYDFTRQGDTILTNYAELWIDYQKEVDEEDFPPYFTEFLILALAAKLAIATTDQVELAQYYEGLAYGSPSDNRNGGEFGRAKKLDAMQQPPSAVIPNDIIAARFI